MKRIRLNGRCMGTQERAHRHLRQRLRLPAYYGNNLDALYDCLTEIGTPTELLLVNARWMRARLGAYGGKLLAVIVAAAAENPRIAVVVREGWL